MKKKIDTVIDENLISEAKNRASSQKLTLSQLFEEALHNYLNLKENEIEKRSIIQETKGAMRISPEKLKAVMEEESFYDN